MTNDVTYLTAAALVLNEASRPLSGREILREIRNRRFATFTNQDQMNHLRTAISRDIRQKGEKSLFVRVGRGLYTLRTLQMLDRQLATSHQRTADARGGKVLVVAADRINKLGHFHGINTDYERFLEELVQCETPIYLDRAEAEASNEYKQIVSYVMVVFENKLLRFTRIPLSVNRAENFVDGGYAIGFGGHVQHNDWNLFTREENDSGYRSSVQRELREEAGIDLENEGLGHDIQLIGVLNDDSTILGRHHFAFIHKVTLSRPIFLGNEDSIRDLQLVSLDEISKGFGEYEYWSKLCLQAFYPTQLQFDCYIQPVSGFTLQEQPDILAVVGGIGSGKSEASQILEREFGYTRVPCSSILKKLVGLDSNAQVDRGQLQDAGYSFVTQANGHVKLAGAIVDYMKANPGAGSKFVLDGLRFPQTMIAIEESLESKITVLYVENTIDNRFQHTKMREGQSYSLSDFVKTTSHPAESEIERFLPMACVVIYNHGSRDSYARALRIYFAKEFSTGRLSENFNLFKQAWDLNARRRHEQILEGLDVTYSKVLEPKILAELTNLPGHEIFSILDVGCGTGILAHKLSPIVPYILGVDASAASIKIAEEYTVNDDNVDFECTNIEQFYQSSLLQFDFAVASMTLHTIRTFESALISIYHCLKPGGTFVFTIPHPAFFPKRKGFVDSDFYNYCTPFFHSVQFTLTNDPKPLPSPTPYFHRPIEMYVSSLYACGFENVRLQEPFPDKETMALYVKPWDRPHSLFVSCKKSYGQNKANSNVLGSYENS